MNERDWWTVRAMEKMGGSFVKALAELAHRADPINLGVIKRAWPEKWLEYEKTGIQFESEAQKK